MSTKIAASESLRRAPLEMDRWLFWPTCSILIIAVGMLLLSGMPGTTNLIFIPLTFLVGLPLLAGCFLWAIVLLTEKRPRKATSFFFAAALPVLLWQQIRWMALILHLGLTVWPGIGALGTTLPQDEAKFRAYDWSVGLAGGSTTFLIFDASDEIARPISLAKQDSAADGDLAQRCRNNVEHLVGHYYVCSF
jgi:hypothetical protein